ncbi:MAG: hydroxyacid dehydrogenase [Planctomycetes bacterium]|nr:hydroxyacid dehydrogenase [Planctomycetota bacterium]
MRVVFLLTVPIVEMCFDPLDVRRLAGLETHFSTASAPDQLATFWKQHASAAEFLVTGWKTPPLTDSMLDDAPNLRAILHAAGSTRHLLPPSVWSRGLRIGSAREALAVGVAESTLGLIIAGLKGFFPASRVAREGGWLIDSNRVHGYEIREMYKSTIGLIGLSKTARHLLKLLKQFEVKVLATDPHVSAEEVEQLGATKVELDELMASSDVVSLHAPALPETRHMLRAPQFKLMRDGAIFVNTARGMIVDEPALAAELRTGRIWALLDVTDPEPPAPDHPFRTLPNVVLLPHIAGAVGSGCKRLGRSVVDQILEFRSGQPMHGEFTAREWAILA